MGKYLDGLREQFDTITEGIEQVLDRAADENREVSDQEAELVKREQVKAEDLKKSIEHYATIERTRADVSATMAKVPTTPAPSTVQRQRVGGQDEPAKPEDLFPTAGDYIVTVARAMRGDKEAAELIQRATQHQTTADNPGLLPSPIVGPVIYGVSNDRPFIESITKKALPAGSFDRPVVTQHVGVGKQDGEKTLTESRKLLVGKLPVAASTYAGHLNISRQDIKWTQPGIMQIIAEDFAHEYARETDQDAVAQFLASITNDPVVVDTFDAASITAAVFAAASAAMSTGDGAPLPDTLWVSPDVWGMFGSLVNNNGTLVFPSVTPTSSAGNPLGLKMVVDPWFEAGTAVVGPSSYLEWFEDVDGLIQVAEPDVLGQLVGYAGYGAFLNTKPTLFTPITVPAPTEPVTAKAKASASK